MIGLVTCENAAFIPASNLAAMAWWGWVLVGAGATLGALGVPLVVWYRRALHSWDYAWGYR